MISDSEIGKIGPFRPQNIAPQEAMDFADASFSATTGSIPKSLTPFDISVSSSTCLCQKIVDGASMDRQTLVDQNGPYETGQKRSLAQQLHRGTVLHDYLVDFYIRGCFPYLHFNAVTIVSTVRRWRVDESSNIG